MLISDGRRPLEARHPQEKETFIVGRSLRLYSCGILNSSFFRWPRDLHLFLLQGKKLLYVYTRCWTLKQHQFLYFIS